jgi:hypothetical protein
MFSYGFLKATYFCHSRCLPERATAAIDSAQFKQALKQQGADIAELVSQCSALRQFVADQASTVFSFPQSGSFVSWLFFAVLW